MGTYRLGVDIGGTFTDLVMIDEESGRLRQVRLPTTPADPFVGFMDVVKRRLAESGIAAGSIRFLIHGTTVATNTIIEWKGAKAALIATEGSGTCWRLRDRSGQMITIASATNPSR